jgi:hypothetical protein
MDKNKAVQILTTLKENMNEPQRKKVDMVLEWVKSVVDDKIFTMTPEERQKRIEELQNGKTT